MSPTPEQALRVVEKYLDGQEPKTRERQYELERALSALRSHLRPKTEQPSGSTLGYGEFIDNLTLSPPSAAAVPSERLEEAIAHICNWFTYMNDHWKSTLGDLIRANVGPLLMGFPAAAQPRAPKEDGDGN